VTRVLVTGAAGFIGSHLVEALSAQGDEIVGIDNFDPFYPRAVKERNLAEVGQPRGFSFREQDMLDVSALRALLTPQTVVVHLAAKAGVRPSLADPVGYATANVTGTAAVLEAARQAGVSRIVFGSSSSVYGDSTPVPFKEDAMATVPMSPYAATKRAGELLLGAVAPIYGFRAASLRFFTVYGPRQRPDLAIHAFARKMVDGRPLTLFGDGTQARDYTYCDDIVAGVLAAIAWTASAPVGVDTFNLGGSRSIPTEAMVAEIAGALGIEPRIEWAPMQPGDVQRTAADLTKSTAVLGYAPKTPFPQGIQRFIRWFREAYGRAD
jgi:UDP-glucuronate 4-epimerase